MKCLSKIDCSMLVMAQLKKKNDEILCAALLYIYGYVELKHNFFFFFVTLCILIDTKERTVNAIINNPCLCLFNSSSRYFSNLSKHLLLLSSHSNHWNQQFLLCGWYLSRCDAFWHYKVWKVWYTHNLQSWLFLRDHVPWSSFFGELFSDTSTYIHCDIPLRWLFYWSWWTQLHLQGNLFALAFCAHYPKHLQFLHCILLLV